MISFIRKLLGFKKYVFKLDLVYLPGCRTELDATLEVYDISYKKARRAAIEYINTIPGVVIKDIELMEDV